MDESTRKEEESTRMEKFERRWKDGCVLGWTRDGQIHEEGTDCGCERIWRAGCELGWMSDG